MFGKHHKKRSSNILFVIFRLILSFVMLTVLLGGSYAAYKQFSGTDPLKLDPLSIAKSLLAARTPQQFVKAIPSFKFDSKTSQPEKTILGEAAKTGSQSDSKESNKRSLFRFLMVADSHSDNANLAKALIQATSAYPDLKFLIGLGDYTEVGTIAELKAAKKVFDSGNLRYFLIPGDHDLWDCRNRSLAPISCFEEVFGSSYQSFIFENFKFLMLDNSDNYKGFDNTQSEWITTELEKVKQEGNKGVLVFLHKPLYHPSSDHVMGAVEKSLKNQAGGLIFQLKEFNTTEVFAGDTHFTSRYQEPKTNLTMSTVGAVTLERNPQVPRFAIVTVFEDGSLRAEDIEIK
ncbi:metallophosphoesterase [Candidatus Daviesbacteria bacterium]|nr:metallophosphoesterase [Candidatus Daviesbacteria bacterium]